MGGRGVPPGNRNAGKGREGKGKEDDEMMKPQREEEEGEKGPKVKRWKKVKMMEGEV